MFNFLNSKNSNINLQDDGRVRGSLFGFFVGDALGVPVEFIDREKLKNKIVKDMEEYGTHNQPKGTWSDDSSMVLATVDSLIKNKKINYKDIMDNFVKWYKEGKYTPFGRPFDIGNATASALNKYIKNPNNYMCGSNDVFSNGNGSLMRILPVSLYLHFNDDNIYETVYNVSSMTHSHIFSIFSCYIYTIFINEYLKIKNVKEAYYSMQKAIKDILEKEETKLIYNPNELKIKFERLIYQDISKFQEKDIKSSGYVIDTLEASFWCLLTTNNYTDSVLKAVNLGDDTDTVAAITGGLSGLVYGYNSIPIKWINTLQQKEMLNEYVKNFMDVIMNDKKNIDIKIISDIINELKNNPNACTTIGGMTSADGTFTIPESNPGEMLSEFINYFYQNGLADMDYVNNYEKMKDKSIDEYSYDETLTALTKIFRGDRFVSGQIYSCFKDGSLLKIIEKLNNFLK